jgi:hypothetical protein
MTSASMEVLERVWNTEILLSGWLSASFILVTASLLFYHMTRVQSLEMDPRVAGIFSVTLIFAALVIAAISIYPYYERVGLVVANQKTTSELRKEKIYRSMYTTVGIVVILIELGMAITIVRGSFFKTKT